MDFLEAIANSKGATRNRGNDFTPGSGVLIVKGFRLGRTLKKQHQIFVADYLVESSRSYPSVPNLKPGAIATANPPGTSCSYFQNYTMWPEIAPGKAMGAMFAAVYEKDLDPNTMSPAQIDAVIKEIIGPKNPCRGVRVAYETTQVQTGKGFWITAVQFSRIAGQTDADVAARRAQLDSGEAYSTTGELAE